MGPCQSKPDQKHPTEQQSQSPAKSTNELPAKQTQQTQSSNSARSQQPPGKEADIFDTVSEKTGKITREYNLVSPPLGKGAYGEVRKAIHKASGQVRAVKILSKQHTSQIEQERLRNEVEILKRLDHPNIIKVYEFFQDDKFFYIVTELCLGGELFDKIQEEKSFTEKKAAQIMKQILSAVYYCHQHKIVHRDLKPENLLLESDKDDANLKVIDFGTSRQFDPSHKLSQRLGTPYYIAPEVLKRKYDEKCDIWSCGVILYILLCGYPPFSGKNDEKILEKVTKGEYDFDSEEWDVISDEAKMFIRKMMEYETPKRYSAQQCLSDPWMKKYAEKSEVDAPQIEKVLSNMKTFRSNLKLQEATFMYIVNQLTTKEEKNELLKTFQALDKNGDGVLSREELVEGYKKTMGQAEAEEEVNKIMAQVDKNNSGAIDYSEFVAASINRQNVLSQQRLETAFKTIDKDGSGSLTVDELKQIFGGGRVPDEIWKQIIDEVDKNGDGQISLAEFKEMMMKLAI